MRLRLVFGGVAAWLAVAACGDLPRLSPNVCGNGIIEAGEDCDTRGVGNNVCSATCRVVCTEDDACPPGWGCGVDDLCRQPSGQLEAFGAPAGITASTLIPADFDGDGRSDLLALQGSSVSVAFLDADGLLPGTAGLSAANVPDPPNFPGVGDVDGDGRDDLVLRSPSGLAVQRGQSDRSFIASPFARSSESLLGVALEAGERLLPVFLSNAFEGGFDQLMAVRQDGLYLVRNRHPDFEGMLPLKILEWEDTGVVPHITVYGGGSGTLFFIATPGESTIRIVRAYYQDPNTLEEVLQAPGAADAPEPQVISLPDGIEVDGPVALLGRGQNDFDLPDVYIAGQDGSGTRRWYGAFNHRNVQGTNGDQTGLYGSYIPVCGDGVIAGNEECEQALNPPQCAFDCTINGTGVLHDADGKMAEVEYVDRESGDPLPGAPSLIVGLDGVDPLVDAVFPDGVYRATCLFSGSDCDLLPAAEGAKVHIESELWFASATPQGWSFVSALNLSPNQDDHELVLGGAEGGMTYLFQSSGSQPAALTIPTQGAVSNVAYTNLTSVGGRDFVFTQRSARASGPDDPLQSLHLAFGTAGSSAPQLPFVDLGDVGSAAQILPILLSEGATPDGVNDFLLLTENDSDVDIYVFEGAVDGNVQSPLNVPASCGLSGVRTGSERFVVMGRFDAEDGEDIAVGFRLDDGTTALYSFSPSSAVTDALCAGLVGPTALSLPDRATARVVAIDLDDDGRDEIVILPLGEDADGEPLIVARAGDDGWEVETLDLGATYKGMAAVELGVAAGAGPDLVLWSDDGIRVLYNEGSGNLTADASATLTLAGAACTDRAADATFGVPTGVAALRLDSDEVRELAVASTDDVMIVTIDPATRQLSEPACRTNAMGGGATALASSDINGDGIDDLVLSRLGGTRVLAGVPITP